MPASDGPCATDGTVAPLRELATDLPRAAEDLVRSAARRSAQRRGGDDVAASGADLEDLAGAGGVPEPGARVGSAPEDLRDDLDGVTEVLDHDLDGDLDSDFDEDETNAAAPTTSARVLHVEDTMSAPASIPGFRAANRWLATLVALHALLAVVLHADSERTAEWLAHVPLVGTTLSNRAALGRQITLRNVRGGYQRLRSDRLVFVISGEAVNDSHAPVERIQVEGALYGATGEVDRKVISTGNETTLRLADLSESEIALLQRFEPRTLIAPGERVSFSIVFLEPPRNLREFSSRVLTARPTARGSRPSTDRAGSPASVG